MSNTTLAQKGTTVKNPFDYAYSITDPNLRAMYMGMANQKAAGDLLALYGTKQVQKALGVNSAEKAQLQFISNFTEFHFAAIGTLLPDLDSIQESVANGTASEEMIAMVNLLLPYSEFLIKVKAGKDDNGKVFGRLPEVTLTLGKLGKNVNIFIKNANNAIKVLNNNNNKNSQKGGMLRYRGPPGPAQMVPRQPARAPLTVAEVERQAAVTQAQMRTSSETATTALFSGLRLLLVVLMVAGITGLLSFAASSGGETLSGWALGADLRAKRTCNGLDSVVGSFTTGFGLWGTNEYKKPTMPRDLAKIIHEWNIPRGTATTLGSESRLFSLTETVEQYGEVLTTVERRYATMEFEFTTSISDLNAGPVVPGIARELEAAEAEVERLYPLTSGRIASEKEPGANSKYRATQQKIEDLKVLKAMNAKITTTPNTNILNIIPAPQRARLSGEAGTYLAKIQVAELSSRLQNMTSNLAVAKNNPNAYLNYTESTIDSSPLWRLLVQEKGKFLENITTPEGQTYANAVFYTQALPCVTAMKEHVLRGRNTASALVEADLIKEQTKKTPTSWDILSRWVNGQVTSCKDNKGLIECMGWSDESRVTRIQDAIIFGARHTSLEAPPPLALEQVLGTIVIDNIPSMDRYDYDLFLYELLQKRNPDPMKRLYYACIASGALAALLIVARKLLNIPLNILTALEEASLLPALKAIIARKNLDAQMALADGAVAQAQDLAASGRAPVPGLQNGQFPPTQQQLLEASLQPMDPNQFLQGLDASYLANPALLGNASGTNQSLVVAQQVQAQQAASDAALARQQGQLQSQLMSMMQMQMMQRMVESATPQRFNVQLPPGWAMGPNGQIYQVQQQPVIQQALANGPTGNGRLPPTALRAMIQGLGPPQQQLANGPRGNAAARAQLPALTNGRVSHSSIVGARGSTTTTAARPPPAPRSTGVVAPQGNAPVWTAPELPAVFVPPPPPPSASNGTGQLAPLLLGPTGNATGNATGPQTPQFGGPGNLGQGGRRRRKSKTSKKRRVQKKNKQTRRR